MTLIPATLSIAFALLGQPPGAAEPPPEDLAARLVHMKGVLAEYDVHSVDNPPSAYRLEPEPVLRFTNTVGATQDGAVFLWLGEHGRPVAAAQVSLRRDGVWFHELSSLSEQPLVATRRGGDPWKPSRGGIELKPIRGASAPATTAEQRLRQMRALADEFSAKDFFRNRDWQPLRMLRKPLARYGDPDSTAIDGALFGYVLTTDPEVLLIIEARKGKAGPEWQFACAPMTIYEVNMSRKGQEVWSGSGFGTHTRASDPNAPFHVRIQATKP